MDTERKNAEHKKGSIGGLHGFVKVIIMSVAESVLVSFLVYDSWWGLALFPVILILNARRNKVEERDNFRKNFREEYMEFLTGIASGLSGGMSIERAFMEEEKSLAEAFGERSFLRSEIRKINGQVRLNQPVEEAFMDFSDRMEMDEVAEFAQIFMYAKRMGGDYVRNIKHTADKIGQNMELARDIDIITAEKRLELKIMCLMPVIIILYIKMSAREFIAPMYGTAAGAIVMSGCLAVYIGCIILGHRITERI